MVKLTTLLCSLSLETEKLTACEEEKQIKQNNREKNEMRESGLY